MHWFVYLCFNVALIFLCINEFWFAYLCFNVALNFLCRNEFRFAYFCFNVELKAHYGIVIDNVESLFV